MINVSKCTNRIFLNHILWIYISKDDNTSIKIEMFCDKCTDIYFFKFQVYLLKSSGDVNLQEKLHGNTPLHYAAREDNSACVTVLLKAGARTDIKNFEGMTCLDEATSLCREIIWEFVCKLSHIFCM